MLAWTECRADTSEDRSIGAGTGEAKVVETKGSVTGTKEGAVGDNESHEEESEIGEIENNVCL